MSGSRQPPDSAVAASEVPEAATAAGRSVTVVAMDDRHQS